MKLVRVIARSIAAVAGAVVLYLFEGYGKIAGPKFRNEVCARGILRKEGWNPVDSAKDVSVPVLIQVALRDNLVSPASYRRVMGLLGERAVTHQYDIGTFDMYTGAPLSARWAIRWPS